MRHLYITGFITAFCSVLLISCKSPEKKPEVEVIFSTDKEITSVVKYANGFDLFQKDSITKVVVYHPELSSVVIGTYYIASAEIAEQYNDSKYFFRTSLDSVALFSATQINAFEKLGLLGKIVGVSESGYIKNSFVREQIVQGKIRELAGSGDFYVETTMMLNPSVIFYSPYKVIEAHPLDVTGIPLIPFYDYHETDPLGRAEWIKFSAVFFGLYNEADSIFKNIVNQYNQYKTYAEAATDKPTVFSDKYFNGQWYIPGGQSYIAKMLADAGSDYLWKDDLQKASFPLDYEVVFQRASNADYWRIVGSYDDIPSYKALQNENGLYSHFKAFKERKVIWCDAEETEYFEKSPLEPHVVLADLIKAFHPGLLPDHQPKYYQLLKD